MMRQKRLNRQSGKGRFAPFRVLSLVAWTGLVVYLASPAAWGLGRWPSDVLPAGDPRANAVVRVGRQVGNQFVGLGTGTVIDIKRDAQGPGGWLCVLTADHVVRGEQNLRIGFGNLRNLPADWPYRVPQRLVFLGPQDPEDPTGARVVDLAILGVRVDDLNALPQMRLPTLTLGAPLPDVPLIVAGFGIQADPDPNIRDRYVGPRRSYGTYRSGRNTIEEDGVRSGYTTLLATYRFRALTYDLDFFYPPGQWPPTDPQRDLGEAHLFSGDSGGPSFQADGNEWFLVGVHSGTNPPRGRDAINEWANAGDLSIDVSVGFYLDWINQTCEMVPEPASLIALAVGLMGLAYGRRRRAA